MVTFADRDAAEGVRETYQYYVGSSAFHFAVDDGSIELHYGRVQDPAVTLTTDDETWANTASGQTTTASAVAAGALRLAGDPRAVARLKKILSRRRVLATADGIVKQASRRP